MAEATAAATAQTNALSRDLIAHRRVTTCQTRELANPKRINDFSMEFLSDRTIAGYASAIWKAEPCPVP